MHLKLAFEVHLIDYLVCEWVLFPFSSLSWHRNFKTSNYRSALCLSSKVKTFLEISLIQSKHGKLIIKVSIISSHNYFHSQVTKHEWGYWSPQNIGRFFSVLIQELVQKLHDFLFSLTDTTIMQDLAVKTKWPTLRKEWFPCCAFHWMQYILFFNLFKPAFWVHLR